MKLRAFFLICLMAAAAWSARSAYRSIRPPWESALPDEIYRELLRDADPAAYYLRSKGNYVAVVPRRRGEEERVTSIELSTLRLADRAMLERGIPAASRQSLLQLLEDLGS